MRFPAEAAVEALSRCKRLRSVVGASAGGPCELVHSGDQWIETARALQSGLNEQSAALVWRIEGGKSTLWLAGSVHVLKAPFHPLPAAFEQAFTQAQRLALNLSIPDQLSRSLSGNAGVHVSYAFTPSWGYWCRNCAWITPGSSKPQPRPVRSHWWRTGSISIRLNQPHRHECTRTLRIRRTGRGRWVRMPSSSMGLPRSSVTGASKGSTISTSVT